jgi:hypothetical protein
LLTDEDLNRLDRYIVEKNKLHNRYLHGWGVVCGLEVVCHPCQGWVTVEPGYALSPCGDDIVVCKGEAVNVCDLVQQCSERERQWDCDPPRADDPNCRESTEQWVFAVCYDEKPARGVAALRAGSAPACCSRCSCGGSSACGCGCHEKAHAPGTAACSSPRPKTPAQCEPTVTCEGASYRIWKAPPRDRKPTVARGAMAERFAACVKEITSQLTALPAAGTPLQKHEWCCAFKRTLLDFAALEGVHDCRLADRVAAVSCPDPASQPPPDYAPVFNQLVRIAAEFLKACLCSTLLPPCPDPPCDNCVPLATVTVRGRDCRILDVCNWGPRKFAVTLPSFGYWLSILPYGRILRDFVERICCQPLFQRDFAPGAVVAPGAGPGFAFATATIDTGAAHPPDKRFAALLLQALANKDRVVDAQTLLLGELGIADATGRQFASRMELEDPLQFLMLNQVVAPMIASTLPGPIAAPARPSPTEPAEIASLRETVARLERAVSEQQGRIEELCARLPNE